jgi:gas vesicle protein
LTEELEPNGPGSEKRRSTRVMHSASITVKGTDALGRPFRETTKTVMVNCYGCKYQSAHYPAPSSTAILEVHHADPRRTARVVPGRIIWVQRPRNYRALYHVGIEFEVPGNVWDIAVPPEDWFPCPEDEELVIPVSAERDDPAPKCFVLPASLLDAEIPGSATKAQAEPGAAAGRATETLVLADDRGTPIWREAAEQENPTVAMRNMVKLVTAEAIADEIMLLRQRIDTQIQEAIDKVVNTLIERVTQRSAAQQTELETMPQDIEDLNQSSSRRKRARKNSRKPLKTAP